MHIPKERIRFNIKRPTEKGRVSYQLIAYYLEGRKAINVPLSPDMKIKVSGLNAQLKSGVIDAETLERQLKELIQQEYARNQVQTMAIRNARLSEDNNKALAAFKKHYLSRSRSKDKQSFILSLAKFLSILGETSVFVSSGIEIENKLLNDCESKAEAARGMRYLNSLLKYLQRLDPNGAPLRLHPPLLPRNKIQYVTDVELKKIVKQMECSVCKTMALAIFGSGLRIGELLALDDSSLKSKILDVQYQIDKSGELAPPKRGSVGRVFVIPQYVEAVESWIDVPDKLNYRYKLYDELEKASRKAFPDGPQRVWVGPHDLRHSHAIHLLSKGATLTQVARNLRNSEEVCRKFYSGWEHVDGTLELLKKILS